VIVRLNRAALPLYEPSGERIELLPVCANWGKKPREYQAHVKDPRGGWIHGRLFALRQSVEATRWARSGCSAAPSAAKRRSFS